MTNPTLESMLRSGHPDVILAGLERALSDRDAASLDAVLGHIDSPHPEVRRKSRETGSLLLVEYLISNFSRVPVEKLDRYIQVLKGLVPDIGEILLKELKNPEADNKAGRFRLLSMIDTAQAEKAVSGAFWDDDPRLRSLSVKILGQFRDPQNLSRILKFLYDKDTRVIANTIETLEAIGNQNLLGVLMRFRGHPNNRVRANTLKALWNMGCKTLHADVQAMLDAESELMQASAVWLVGQIGGSDAEFVKMLEPLIFSDRPLVRSNLIKTLQRIRQPLAEALLKKIRPPEGVETEDRARDRLHQVRLERDENTRATAVKLLSTLINPNDLSEVVAFLNDPDHRVVANTIEALEAIGNRKVIEYIQKYRGHPHNRVRANALKALFAYGFRNIGDDLRKMLNDKQPLMRASGAWLIGEIGHHDLTLSELLNIVKNDAVEIVRTNVAKAQRKINSAFLSGHKTPDEALVESAKAVMAQGVKWSGSIPALSTEALLIKAVELTQKKPAAMRTRLGTLTDAGLFQHPQGSPTDDLLLVPDPDALDLFLYYCQSIRLLEHTAWTNLSDGATLILRNLSYLSQKHGRIHETKVLFPLAALDEADLPTDLDIPAKIRELERRGLVESIEEKGESFLLFQREKVYKILKTLKWLPRFKIILEK